MASGPVAHGREPWRSQYDSISEYSAEPYRQGRVYRVNVADLSPTQFSVGMGEVEARMEKLADMDKGELRRYLKEKVGKVVIGPGERFWLVDGHHLGRALYELELPEMLVELVADWSRLEPETFFRRMIRSKRMWLKDHRGQGPLDPSRLPRALSGLKDDPYRTLAYKVRKRGGFDKTDVPFAEFYWADFFRERIPLSKLRGEPQAALKKATQLARAKEAARLPGHSGDTAFCAGLLLGGA